MTDWLISLYQQQKNSNSVTLTLTHFWSWSHLHWGELWRSRSVAWHRQHEAVSHSGSHGPPWKHLDQSSAGHTLSYLLREMMKNDFYSEQIEYWLPQEKSQKGNRHLFPEGLKSGRESFCNFVLRWAEELLFSLNRFRLKFNLRGFPLPVIWFFFQINIAIAWIHFVKFPKRL